MMSCAVCTTQQPPLSLSLVQILLNGDIERRQRDMVAEGATKGAEWRERDLALKVQPKVQKKQRPK